MKTLIVLFTLVSATAFANESNESNLFAQALFDNSAKMTEIKAECNSRVSDGVTTEVSNGHYTHTFKLLRFFRSMPGRDCLVTIEQNLTPTYHDAPIEYQVTVTHLAP